jgi:outer membrane protein assembly factor BamB
MTRSSLLVALTASCTLAGCGGGAAFTNLFPDNKPEQIDMILSSAGAPSPTTEPVNRTGRPLLATVLGGGKSLALYDLEKGETLWNIDVAVDSRPAIGPDAVVFRSGDDVVAVDLGSGKRLWKKGLAAQNLYGFAFDSGMVFVTQGNTDGGVSATGRTGTIWALDEASGSKKWGMSVDKMLGGPAARAGMVFIPWDRQSISVLDARTGDELCRVLRRDGTVDYVEAGPEGVFYGSKSDIMRLTSRSAAGTKDGAAHLDFDPVEMPGQPPLHIDTFESDKSDHGARARIRLLWSPGTEKKEDALALDSNVIYFLFYKYVIAIDTTDGTTRWVHGSDEPIAWAEAGMGGVFYLEEDGGVMFLDAGDGALGEIGALDGKPVSAGFDTGAFRPEAPGEPKKLMWGLRDLVFDVDTQVLPLRKYALKLMADLPSETVTMDLLEVLRSSHVPKAMRDQAALMLRGREGGVDFLKDALQYHADYLGDTTAPPVGAIASSLANAKEKSALPLLLSHLRDHETPTADLVELTEAIIELGDVSAVPDLERFLVMYHADSCLSTNIDILVNVAEAIVKFGGEEGKAKVNEIIADPYTGSVLKSKLSDVVK